MEQGRRFEQQIQLVQSAGGLIRARYVLDSREEHRNGFVSGSFRRAINDLVRIFQAEGDDIARLQLAAFRLFAVYVKPTALPAVFNIEMISFTDDSGAIARN